MKKLLALIIILTICTPIVYAKNIPIKNSKGQTTGYYQIHSSGKVSQRNRHGGLEYTYKKNPGGRTTKYSKTGQKLETF